MLSKPNRPVLPTEEMGEVTLVYYFFKEEYRKGLAALKNRKAAGIDDVLVEQLKNLGFGSKRHSLQVVELSQQTRTAVQIVSNPPAPSNGGPIYRFLGMPAMRTRWMAGAAAHKSG